MAVYPTHEESPLPPPQQCQSEAEDETDDELKAQPKVAPQHDNEKKRNRPRWLRWFFWNKPPEGEGKTKRSIMGRIGALFRKSSDKDKSETSSPNPYAEQPAQQTPPPGYNQFNQNQYNGNQQFSATRPSVPSGLPAGPRPGGFPGSVAPGPPAHTNSFGNTTVPEQVPPPRYSPTGGQVPPYGSPANTSSSAGASPGPATTSRFDGRSGYAREKFGAQDGFGKNRYEAAPSPYGDQSATAPSPRPGGYGNLEDDNGGLFANYSGPSKQGSSPQLSGSASPQPPVGGQQALASRAEMTQEELEEAEYQDIRSEINQTRDATEQSLHRSLARGNEALARTAAIQAELDRQGEMLVHANNQMLESQIEAEKSTSNVKDLQDATGSMFKIFVARNRREKLDDERLRQELQAKQLRQQAEMEKREFGRADGRVQLPATQRTLGTSVNREQMKKFVLEEEDEEQEMRIHAQQDDLLHLVQGVRAGAQQIGTTVEKQNVLIRSMAERADRVQDKLIVNENRLRRIG